MSYDITLTFADKGDALLVLEAMGEQLQLRPSRGRYEEVEETVSEQVLAHFGGDRPPRVKELAGHATLPATLRWVVGARDRGGALRWSETARRAAEALAAREGAVDVDTLLMLAEVWLSASHPRGTLPEVPAALKKLAEELAADASFPVVGPDVDVPPLVDALQLAAAGGEYDEEDPVMRALAAKVVRVAGDRATADQREGAK
jgi:hypothetical protein